MEVSEDEENEAKAGGVDEDEDDDDDQVPIIKKKLFLRHWRERQYNPEYLTRYQFHKQFTCVSSSLNNSWSLKIY